MQFSALVILSAALSTLASPVRREPLVNELVARALVSITVCTDVNFGGQCLLITTPEHQCATVGGLFSDSVSSIRLDPNVSCDFFQDTGCSGSSGSLRINFVSENDLRLQNFNDVISSWKCQT
ncbi:hypothetical protein DFH09DRAFT_1360607 [Mycena vulgaris]|nr:hypothetical protein DFH09DRAFT_1360607 [Mycena vulgaris]